VPPEKSFNGFTQLIFRLEASSVECLALQQAEHDSIWFSQLAEVGVK